MQATASSTAPSVGRLQATETALLICDVQERFRDIISGFSGVVDTARRMARGAEALEIPVIATEQYPKALGSTVEELKQVLPQGAFIQDKNRFTMCGRVPTLPVGLYKDRRAVTKIFKPEELR